MLPSLKGSYLLILYLTNERNIQIGQAGTQIFPSGYYLYTGSAFGPGGIKARLGRHLSSPHVPHWHIDYIVEHTIPLGYAWLAEPTSRECDWIEILTNLRQASFPVKGFGSSDCRRGCPAHLVHFPTRQDVEDALTVLRAAEKERQSRFHFEMLDNPPTLC